MSRTCTICINPCRDEIDKALVDSQPYRAVARQFGVSDDAVLRHIRPISVPIWEHAGKWGSEGRLERTRGKPARDQAGPSVPRSSNGPCSYVVSGLAVLFREISVKDSPPIARALPDREIEELDFL
jgi:hypothetical protein